jgi:TnpA family transposase
VFLSVLWLWYAHGAKTLVVAPAASPHAVFFNRLGEMRDRSFENQRYRAGGLTLLTAAIILWNTVYLERAVQALRNYGYPVNDSLLQHLSPLGWCWRR